MGSMQAEKNSSRAALPWRVLLIAPEAPPYGGMALQAGLLQSLLRQDGNDVEFFASNFAVPRWGQAPGVRTVLRALLIWFKLWGPVRRAGVVHVFAASWWYFYLVVYPSVILGRLCGRRVVMNYRGGEAAHFFRWNLWLLAPAFHMARVITAPSEFLAAVIEDRFGIQAEIVPNILNLSAFRYRRRERFQPNLLVTRHLEKIYDVESVLRAFREIQDRYPEASLWVAGTGCQESYLKDLAARLELQNVQFLGHVAHCDLPGICGRRDILLNASTVDNFPGALLEASAAGLVVVSTGAGGIPYIYKDGLDALVVEPGNWRALARAAMRVLDDQALAHDLAASAERLARRCDWREVRGRLYHAYGIPVQNRQEQVI